MKRLLSLFLTVLVFAASLSAADPQPTAVKSNFSWGVDLGSSIDLSSNDMSTINIEACFGYRNAWLDMAGVGAGINMMVSNSCRTFPVFAVFRSSFRSRPVLCFLDLRAGVAFNELTGNRKQTAPYINPSVGFNLARSANFKSYVSVGYLYNGIDSFGPADDRTVISHGLSMAVVRIGIAF